MRKKRRILAAVAVSATLVGAAGVVGASWVKSPQEAAAEHQAPEPSVLSAAIEQRVLSDTVVVRGDVVVSGTFAVTPVAPGENRALVTGVRVKAGEDVSSGDPLLEVSGRPVVVFEGNVPAYRDLRPGADGDDVAQLQAALADRGFGSGEDPEGFFGSGTKGAVEEFYESIGFAAPTTGDEDQVEAADDAVKAARRALDVANREEDRLKDDVDDSDPGDDALEDAEYQVTIAEEDLADAQQAHADAVRVSGPMVPLSEFVFASKIPARVHKLHVGVGDELTDKAMTLSTGELAVTTRVDAGMRELLAEDMPVEIFAERTDVKVEGTISSIGEFSDDAEQGPGHTVTVVPATEMSRDLVGEDVRLTFTAAATTDPVLVVPLSAVSAAADGTTVVVRLTADGGQERVVVDAGVSGDGFVEVAPQDDGSLAEGDQVVVGEQ